MDPVNIARKFLGCDNINRIIPYGNGLINMTWRVETETEKFILQKINRAVFPRPEQIMVNLEMMQVHFERHSPGFIKLQLPKVLTTTGIERQCYYIDDDSSFWRALSFIDDSESIEHIRTQADVEQVGFALGHFHRLFSDMNIDTLFDTLPGFHVTPSYLEHYRQLLDGQPLEANDTVVMFCHDFITRHQHLATVLEQAKHQQTLTLRIIHGDPKLNNFLFERNSGRALSIIDLDTCKPGLLHYDIGDCLRSCCLTYDTNGIVNFDMHICRVLLTSYLHEVRDFFSDQDYDFLFSAIQLMPFELGLRFFTDYLEGNRYFKVTGSRQNIDRAKTQFQLMESITRQRADIQQLIDTLRLKNQSR